MNSTEHNREMEAESLIKLVKCPKCSSDKLQIIEVWTEHTIAWAVDNNSIVYRDGALEPGSPYKVEGYCVSCKYGWRFRGVHQITDLIRERGQQ